MDNITLLKILNNKITKLAKYSFKNEAFGFDFIKKIIISIILEKPYYITVHELNIDSLKSIFKIFAGFNFFNINMKDVEEMEEIVGFQDANGEIQTIGFSPKAEIVFLDNIWNTDPELIRNLSDLISTNSYSFENVMIETNTKVFVGASSFESKPNLKYARLWNSFFIKDQHISKIKDLDEILDLDIINENEKIDNSDLDFIDRNYDDVLIDLSILQKIMGIKSEIILANKPFENKTSEFEKLKIDDKSWDYIIRAIKISAFVCGREHVEVQDLNIIIPIVCSLPIQYDIVSKIILDIANKDAKISLPLEDNKVMNDVLVKKISNEILLEFQKIDVAVDILKSHRKNEIKREKRLEIVRNNFNIINASGSLIDPSDIFNTYKSLDKIMEDLSSNNWIPNNDLALENKEVISYNLKKENELETLVNQDSFLNLDFGNNKPRIYDANSHVVKAKIELEEKNKIQELLQLREQKKIQESIDLENIKKDLISKIELERSKKLSNLNNEFKSEPAKEKEKNNYNEILFGSYSSYRKMVLDAIGDLSFGDVETYRKPFTNLVDTFYLMTDENEDSFMGSSKHLNQISYARPHVEVPVCSKNDYFQNKNIFETKIVYLIDGKYYIKDNNKKNRVAFSLSEIRNDFIFPSLISISLTQKFVKEGKFLIDYFNNIENKIKFKLNDNDELEKNYLVDLLTNFLIVKNKLSTFIRWIKNSNEIEGSIKLLLPEFSSL